MREGLPFVSVSIYVAHRSFYYNALTHKSLVRVVFKRIRGRERKREREKEKKIKGEIERESEKESKKE